MIENDFIEEFPILKIHSQLTIRSENLSCEILKSYHFILKLMFWNITSFKSLLYFLLIIEQRNINRLDWIHITKI